MARQEKAVHSAEYWEKRARRKKLARQRQLRRRIAAAAVVFVVLAVIIGVAVRMRKPAEAPPAEPVREPVVITPEATGSTVSVAESDAAAEAARCTFSNAEKASFPVPLNAAFAALRTAVDESLAGTRLAKDRAAKCLTTVMIPEALDYPM